MEAVFSLLSVFRESLNVFFLSAALFPGTSELNLRNQNINTLGPPGRPPVDGHGLKPFGHTAFGHQSVCI